MKNRYCGRDVWRSVTGACSSAEDRKSGSLETIPVADAFGNLQPLKVSDFLGRIRYVALETNDSVLVGEGLISVCCRVISW